MFIIRTKFLSDYDGYDINVIATELRFTEMKSTSCYKETQSFIRNNANRCKCKVL